MSRRFALFAAALAWLLVVGMGAALADAPEALAWLRAQQHDDGGFGGDFDSASSTGATVDAVLAIVAAGEDPAAWSVRGNTPLSYLQSQAGSLTAAGDLARVILAAGAAGANPQDFDGVDLVMALEGTLGSNNLYGAETGTIFTQALSLLALRSVGRSVPDAAVTAITAVQLDDGSWSWSGDTTENAGDSNTTAIVVQALVALGGPDEAVAAAVDYLVGLQNDDGGFPYQNPSSFGTDTDANSTAYVVQALIAAGLDPATVASGDGLSPLDALAALQKDNGAFRWQAAVEDENYLATVQAVPALTGKDFLKIAGITPGREGATPQALPESGGVLPALAQDPAGENRAGLVVQFGDGRVVSECVSFPEEEISGLELLQRSSLAVVVDVQGGLGAAVCKIEAEGCDLPAEDCFCRCRGADCAYWNYFQWRATAGDEGWGYAQAGASTARVRHGDLNGWLWGDAGGLPADLSFTSVCSPSASPTSTNPPTATATVARSSEATSLPTQQAAAGLSVGEATSAPTPRSSVPTVAATESPSTSFAAEESNRPAIWYFAGTLVVLGVLSLAVRWRQRAGG